MLATQLNSLVADKQVRNGCPMLPCPCHQLLAFCVLRGFAHSRSRSPHSPAAVGRCWLVCSHLIACAFYSRGSSWQVQKWSIITVSECICNVVQNRRIVILLNIEVCGSRTSHPASPFDASDSDSLLLRRTCAFGVQ